MPAKQPVNVLTTPRTRLLRTQRKSNALWESRAMLLDAKCTPPSPVRVLNSSDSEMYPNLMMSSRKEVPVEAEEAVVEEAVVVVVIDNNKLPVRSNSSSAKVAERAVALLETRTSSPAFERAVGLCCP